MISGKYRSPNRVHDRDVFYKYMTVQTAKIVLANRTLRWSSPLLFNDPFDVTQELRLNFDEATLSAQLQERFASLMEHGDPEGHVKRPEVALLLRMLDGFSSDKRLAMANELRQDDHRPSTGQFTALQELRKVWSEMVPTFRILCLSELNDVTPIWNHYSDGYKGVVLEFSAIDELDSPFLVARPVVYQNEPPAVADPEAWIDCMLGIGERKYEDLFTQLQYVKTNPWAYEKEWRIVSGARPGEAGLFQDYEFHPQELTGLTFGERCAAEDRADLLNLLIHGLEHVKVFEAVSDTQAPKFVFRPVER